MYTNVVLYQRKTSEMGFKNHVCTYGATRYPNSQVRIATDVAFGTMPEKLLGPKTVMRQIKGCRDVAEEAIRIVESLYILRCYGCLAA